MHSVFRTALSRFAAQALKVNSRPTTACRNFTPTSGSRCFSASSPTLISKFDSLGLDATPAVKSPDISGRHASFASGRRLSEFSLEGKVVIISGGVGGVGIQQSEALMEAGAHGMYSSCNSLREGIANIFIPSHAVYCLDRVSTDGLPKDYYRLKERGEIELGVLLDYRKVDVRNPVDVDEIVEAIANKHGRVDGLVAAAGINKVISAFEHKASDFDEVLGINVKGVFLCAQAVAKQMVRFGNGGSIALIGSMSGTVANKVSSPPPKKKKNLLVSSFTPCGDANLSGRDSTAPHTMPPKRP